MRRCISNTDTSMFEAFRPTSEVPLLKHKIRNSGRNVILFGPKIQNGLFQLKIFVVETKSGKSKVQERMLKIRRCQFEVRRGMFNRGGGYLRLPKGCLRGRDGQAEGSC